MLKKGLAACDKRRGGLLTEIIRADKYSFGRGDQIEVEVQRRSPSEEKAGIAAAVRAHVSKRSRDSRQVRPKRAGIVRIYIARTERARTVGVERSRNDGSLSA